MAFFYKGQASPLTYTQRMRQAIDTPRGRAIYSQRMATVEPVFANLRFNKRLDRFTLRGPAKVSTQWQLLLLGAQHREARTKRICSLKKARMEAYFQAFSCLNGGVCGKLTK